MSSNVEQDVYRRQDGTVWTRRKEYYYPGTRQHRIVWLDPSGRRMLSGSGEWEELERELREGRLSAHAAAPGE